jgi:TrpR family trp operon transcriptional repressor
MRSPRPIYRLDEIALCLSRIDDGARIEAFLRSLLTEAEIEEISSRWELVKMLERGVSQRKTAHALGLSLCKITRGSRELKRRPSPFREMIDTWKRIGAEADPEETGGRAEAG